MLIRHVPVSEPPEPDRDARLIAVATRLLDSAGQAQKSSAVDSQALNATRQAAKKAKERIREAARPQETDEVSQSSAASKADGNRSFQLLYDSDVRPCTI